MRSSGYESIVRIINRWETERMSKYKVGDKVIIRKDLKVGEVYGECYWCDGTEYMKEKDYVVIEVVDEDGDYLVEGVWCINDEMIEGLYEEDEAKKSPFFDKFTKHDPFEEKYYIRMKGNEDEYLNLNVIKGGYFMNDTDEYGPHKTKFTKEECDGIIGTSSILYKEEC